MSANEVLEQVKALPPRERRKFFDCVRELETGSKWKRRCPGGANWPANSWALADAGLSREATLLAI